VKEKHGGRLRGTGSAIAETVPQGMVQHVHAGAPEKPKSS